MTEKSETVVFIQANSKFLVEISAVINSPGCSKHKICLVCALTHPKEDDLSTAKT